MLICVFVNRYFRQQNHSLKPLYYHTYPNGTSKEGRTLDVSTKKLSVSLTLALARRVSVTGIFRLL